ncbi:MAG: hypothetical protein ACI9W4_002465 [Rhodothermales bacterium]|jgi:hypothetical protein
MYSISTRFGLFALAFLFLLAGCDSSSGIEDNDNRLGALAGEFSAQISGAVSSRIQGQAMSRSGGWDGSAFLSSLGCKGDFAKDGEDDWDDGFMGDCEEGDDANGAVFLSLELIPDGADPNDPNEVIFLGLEGALAVGSYPISGFKFGDDEVGDSTDIDSGVADLYAWGDYLRLADGMIEEYAGSTGTLTLTSVGDSTISGTFAFSAERCLCMTEAEAELFETAIDAIFDSVGGFGDDDEAFEAAWAEIEGQFDQLLDQYLVDRPLSVDGSFVDVRLVEKSWDDWDHDGDDDGTDSADGGNG